MVLVSLECEYRHYETMDTYEWASEVLSRQVKQLGKGFANS